MYRRSLLGSAALAALVAIACSSSPENPSAPSAAPAATPDAAVDGTTLKATAPTPLSPINDQRLKNRQPTMRFGNAQGRFVGGSFSHDVQLLNTNGRVLRSARLPARGDTSTWAYPTELERNTRYLWRARAVFDGAEGPWSANASFWTVAFKRTPDPPVGGRLPLPNHAHIVHQVAAQYSHLLQRSCQHHGGTWEYMDKLVDTLREEDTRWGYNWKRGKVGDPSLDVIAYHRYRGRDEGAIEVYLVDVILGHCGPNPGPTWNDITRITRDSGNIGRWTGRGRF